MGMCGVPQPNTQTSYQLSCHSSSTCISECGTPSRACLRFFWTQKAFETQINIFNPKLFWLNISLLENFCSDNWCWVLKSQLRGVLSRIKEGGMQVMEDWKYMAMVLDRLFLWLFTLTCLLGTGFIILRAPSLYDMREPIDARHTTIGN